MRRKSGGGESASPHRELANVAATAAAGGSGAARSGREFGIEDAGDLVAGSFEVRLGVVVGGLGERGRDPGAQGLQLAAVRAASHRRTTADELRRIELRVTTCR